VVFFSPTPITSIDDQSPLTLRTIKGCLFSTSPPSSVFRWNRYVPGYGRWESGPCLVNSGESTPEPPLPPLGLPPFPPLSGRRKPSAIFLPIPSEFPHVLYPPALLLVPSASPPLLAFFPGSSGRFRIPYRIAPASESLRISLFSPHNESLSSYNAAFFFVKTPFYVGP